MNESAVEIASIELLSADLPKAESEYVNIVWNTLSDRVLTAEERNQVLVAAKERGLKRDDRDRLHRLILKNVAMAFLAQGEMTPESKGDLVRLGRLAGVPDTDIEQILSDAKSATDELAAIAAALIPQKKSWGLPTVRWPSLPSVNVTKLVSTVTVSSVAVANVASAIALSRTSICSKCKKETPHRISVAKDFPISVWGKILWKSITPSVPGFVLNAAALAATDRKLMSQTGSSLVPRFYCTLCKKETNSYQSASLMISIFKPASKADEVESPLQSSDVSPIVVRTKK